MIAFEEYRLKFIRGRAQNILDSMLPIFAQVVRDSCPVAPKDYTRTVSAGLARYINAQDKTLSNYATEIISTLFGMVFESEQGQVHVSDTTLKLLEDSDQPAFFKVIVSRLQYPNPMNSSLADVRESIADGIFIRPLVLVLEVLNALQSPATYLELRTFVLANKFALNGTYSAGEIAAQIWEAREQGLTLPDPDFPNRPYNHQHVKEMLSLLELANLVRNHPEFGYALNMGESEYLDWLFGVSSTNGLFRNPKPGETHRQYRQAWSQFYGSLDLPSVQVFDTPVEALDIQVDEYGVGQTPTSGSRSLVTTELGRVGELLVYNWQRVLVGDKRPQDLKHVKDRSGERGIGYDIQSVWTDGSARAGVFRYLEVKTTKRTTKPSDAGSQLDLVTLTSNEYRAARTHASNFTVCRVYLFQGGFEIHAIDDPFGKSELNEVILEPSSWNLFIPRTLLESPAHYGA